MVYFIAEPCFSTVIPLFGLSPVFLGILLVAHPFMPFSWYISEYFGFRSRKWFSQSTNPTFFPAGEAFNLISYDIFHNLIECSLMAQLYLYPIVALWWKPHTIVDRAQKRSIRRRGMQHNLWWIDKLMNAKNWLIDYHNIYINIICYMLKKM